MKRPTNRISEDAAVELLRRLFPVSLETDELSLDEVYVAAGRSNLNPQTNRNWLNGVLTKLKDHKFITTGNKFENSRSKLDKIKLTTAGKTALGRTNNEENTVDRPPKDNVPQKNDLSLDEMLNIVEGLKAKHPKWDIVFEVRAKSSASNPPERHS